MKTTLTIAALLFFGTLAHAQPARDVTAPEADFMNKVSTALLASIPKDFKGWDVNFPNYDNAVAGVTRCSTCSYGKDCFWNLGFHVIYDGTTQDTPDYTAFRDSMKTTPFDWHYVALMTRYTNTHQLTVDISVNETLLIGDFKYCSTGYKTLPPPAGFDHYLFASVSSCFPTSAKGNILDVNLFTMKINPVVTNHPEDGYSQGSITFPLNRTLPTPFKVQSVTLRIYGSKALAKEFISKMNIAELKKLL